MSLSPPLPKYVLPFASSVRVFCFFLSGFTEFDWRFPPRLHARRYVRNNRHHRNPHHRAIIFIAHLSRTRGASPFRFVFYFFSFFASRVLTGVVFFFGVSSSSRRRLLLAHNCFGNTIAKIDDIDLLTFIFLPMVFFFVLPSL